MAGDRIQVTASLHELFGRETTLKALVFILSGAIALTFISQMSVLGSELSLFKRIVLLLLTLDIGGGVIANFTRGTNNYYAESRNRRLLFISVHFIQPLVLCWVFPADFFVISVLTLFTLVSSFLVVSLYGKQIAMPLALLLLFAGVVILFTSVVINTVLVWILLVYMVKLVVAFSVNWTNANS